MNLARLALPLVTLLPLLACASRPAPSGQPAPAAPKPALRGEITADRPARGKLLLGYRTAAEQRALASGEGTHAMLRALIERLEIIGEVDFQRTPRLPYLIEGAPSDATPVAFVDERGALWETLMGHGLAGEGAAGGGPLALRTAPTPAPRPEPCAGDRRRLILIEAPGLPASPRRFCAWLPPSWEKQPQRRYPMVWMFPGLFSKDTSYLRGKQHVGERFDAISAELGREAVLVGVDTSAPEGSTYLEGPWDTFLTGKAVTTLTEQLRALPERTARAVIGQSTGGYNALAFGLRHPDFLSAIGSSSPDPPDFGPWLIDPETRMARGWVRRWLMLEATIGGPGQMRSWATTFSPDPSAPSGVRWPFEFSTGEPSAETLALWTRHSPQGLLASPEQAARLAPLRGRIAITAGRRDEFGLFEPAERMARELNQRGLEATFQPTDTGHGHEQERLAWLLRWLLPRLDAAAP